MLLPREMKAGPLWLGFISQEYMQQFHEIKWWSNWKSPYLKNLYSKNSDWSTQDQIILSDEVATEKGYDFFPRVLWLGFSGP